MHVVSLFGILYCMKIIHNILKVILVLIACMPILGTIGVFPEPTADMYGSPEAYQFIAILYESKYVLYMLAVAFLIAVISIITRRTALAALVLLPVTLNIVGFHAFLDTGIFSAGAIMGNILFLINMYFLWINRGVYKVIYNSKE